MSRRLAGLALAALVVAGGSRGALRADDGAPDDTDGGYTAYDGDAGSSSIDYTDELEGWQTDSSSDPSTDPTVDPFAGFADASADSSADPWADSSAGWSADSSADPSADSYSGWSAGSSADLYAPSWDPLADPLAAPLLDSGSDTTTDPFAGYDPFTTAYELPSDPSDPSTLASSLEPDYASLLTEASAAEPTAYTAGDDLLLSEVAAATGISTGDLAAANPGVDPSDVFSGETLALPGSSADLGAGTDATGSASSGDVVQRMVDAANAITAQHYPYLWGGGHNGSFSGPYDCSGSVSAVLHAAGLLDAPLVARQFESWGDPGPGRVTLYASNTHVYMSIDGSFFGTSPQNPGGGAAWFNGAPRAGFVQRHVPLD